MWWRDQPTDDGRQTTQWRSLSILRRLSSVVILSALTAGCFQPLYGERTLVGDSSLQQRMSAVEVEPIKAAQGTPEARIAVELRNALIFGLTGGSGAAPPTHRLVVQLSSQRVSVIVDVITSRPDVEEVRVNATYSLVEIATGKRVAVGRTFGLASFDIPGQQQRFARVRGQRDAQDRAVQVIADAIRSRLASYFVAGT
jgi:LPS-assembly lipoprotein